MTVSNSAAAVASNGRRDVSDVAAEALSRDELAAIAAVLEATPDAVIAVDRQARITWANARATGFLGSGANSLVGTLIGSLLADLDGLDALLACVTGDVPLSDHTLHFATASGHPVTVSAASGAFPGPDEQILLHLRDVTQRAAKEDDLARANAELEHCVNALAHDLRSPLVALLGFSRLLRQDYGELLDETGNHFIDRIDQAGCTMESLVHDMLELSSIGRPGESREMVDTRSLLAQIEAELKPKLDAVGLHMEIPDDLPPVYAHPIRLYQVFSNLVGNAIEHAGPNRDPRIHIAIVDDGDVHRICVRDHGRGIPLESQERIFEVFESLNTVPGRKSGTGIGLAIVKKIAETHRGRVWVESRPGRGAAFHLTIAKRGDPILA